MGNRRETRIRVWVAATLVFAFVASLLPAVLEADRSTRARSDKHLVPRLAEPVQVDTPAESRAYPENSIGVLPVEPRWADARSSEVPPGFIGDFAVRGVVVDAAGTPVSGAIVEVRPGWIITRMTPFSDAQVSVLATKSDGRGHFQFNALPRAHDYRIEAVSAHLIGSTVVQRQRSAEGAIGDVRVVLHPTYLERIRFENDSGDAVVPAGGGPRPLYGQTLFQSEFGPPSLPVARKLNALGIDSEVAEGEYLIVYAKLELSMPPGSDPKPFVENLRRGDFALPRTVSDPRWQPVQYRSGPHRSGEAAKPCMVALTPPDAPDGLCVYRVELPDVPTPEPWGSCSSEYGLRIAVAGSIESMVVTPQQPTFVAPTDAVLELRIAGLPDVLPIRRSTRDGQVVLTPTFPDFGFIVVHYDVKTLDSPTFLTLHSADDAPNVALQLAELFPGYARIGPVPVGEYRIRLQWTSGAPDSAGAAMHEDWHGPLRIRQGYNVVHWR